LLTLARKSIVEGYSKQKPLAPDPADLAGHLGERLGSFVTLTRQDTLRGCIGSIEASEPLARCVTRAAYNAAYHDTRFPPLSPHEFADTAIEISVLSRPEAIDARSRAELLAQLRPREDGLLLEDAGHRATFLPKVWDKLPEPAEFVGQLMRKAGLPADFWSDSLRMYRYGAVSIAEPPATTL